MLTWYWDQQLESRPRLHTAACTSILPDTRLSTGKVRGASHDILWCSGCEQIH